VPHLAALFNFFIAAGGTVGMICTALFTTTSVNPAGAQGAFYGNPMLLGKTLLVLVIVVPWFCVATWGCLLVTDKIMSLRVSGELLLTQL
jgi:Amt family ammonium transporter